MMKPLNLVLTYIERSRYQQHLHFSGWVRIFKGWGRDDYTESTGETLSSRSNSLSYLKPVSDPFEHSTQYIAQPCGGSGDTTTGHSQSTLGVDRGTLHIEFADDQIASIPVSDPLIRLDYFKHVDAKLSTAAPQTKCGSS